jgi:hypothetical protein
MLETPTKFYLNGMAISPKMAKLFDHIVEKEGSLILIKGLPPKEDENVDKKG